MRVSIFLLLFVCWIYSFYGTIDIFIIVSSELQGNLQGFMASASPAIQSVSLRVGKPAVLDW